MYIKRLKGRTSGIQESLLIFQIRWVSSKFLQLPTLSEDH